MIENADSAELSLRRSKNVATIVIDRPSRRNALTKAHWDALPGLVERGSRARALIVRGASDVFCAGADIAEFPTERAAGPPARIYEAANEAAFAALRNCPVPTIALVRGYAIGGGFGLAAACDLRFATPDAVFAVPAARLGLGYPVDAMRDIVGAIGQMRAKQMLMTAARYDAATMLEWGFLTGVCPDPEIDGHIGDLAAQIAANAPLTLRAAKAAIHAADTGLPSDRDHAAALGERTFASADYAEGVEAFTQSRAPIFEGR